MTILLTTPLVHESGHGKVQETYNELKILCFRPWTVQRKIEIIVNYGNTVDDLWVGGKTHQNVILVKNTPAQTDGFVETAPADPAYDVLHVLVVTQDDVGKSMHEQVLKQLYQYLIDEGFYAGTVQ